MADTSQGAPGFYITLNTLCTTAMHTHRNPVQHSTLWRAHHHT